MAESDVEVADWGPRLGMREMSDERRALIWGLNRLAAWVVGHPELPVPRVEARVYAGDGGWDAERAVVDQVATALGVTVPLLDEKGFYEVEVVFGSVEVSATAIHPDRMARYDAERSYRGSVTPSTSTAGGDGR